MIVVTSVIKITLVIIDNILKVLLTLIVIGSVASCNNKVIKASSTALLSLTLYFENVEEIKKQIITVLEKIRPFIQRDGGDIELVDYKDGEVFVKMIGACAGCDLIESTLQDGVATLLKEEVPGIVKVTNVANEENGLNQ